MTSVIPLLVAINATFTLEMSILSVYRRLPVYEAVPLAVLCAAVGAVVLTTVGVATLDFFLTDGLGEGVLIVLVAVNIAVSAFTGFVSVLVNVHHPTSWRTPSLAFAFCAALLWAVEPFDIQFAPFMLGTGAIVWFVSCLFLRRKGAPSPTHVLQA